MGWKQKIAKFTEQVHIRQTRSEVKAFRVALREIGLTASELLRATITALISKDDRKMILQILRKHLPQGVAVWWFVYH